MIVHLQRATGPELTATVDADTITGGGEVSQQGTSFRIRDRDGDVTTQTVRGAGITIRALIESVSDQLGDVSVDAVTQARIPRPGRGDSTVIANPPGLGLAGANGYEDDKSPTFYVENGAANVPAFFRPLEAGDPTDQNYLDVLQPAGGNLDLFLTTTATQLSPQIVVDPKAPKVDEAVDFAVTGAGGHGEATYTWSIDGEPATGPTPTHTWRKSGPYSVTVDVATADGSAGSQTVTVQVGEKPDPGGNGPEGPGGGGGPNTFGPNHSPGDGTGDPDGQPGDGPNGDPGAGDGAGTDGPGEQEQPGTPGRKDQDDTPLGVGDDSVSGILLTAASAPVTSSEDPAPVAAASARRTPEPQRDPLVYAAFAVPLLLLAGALSEYRLAVAAAAARTTRRLRRRKENTMGENA